MSNLPEVAVSPSGLEFNHAASAPVVHYAAPHHYAEQHQSLPSKRESPSVGGDDKGVPKSPPSICGVRRSTFWLAVILAIVVIAAAVGGGVGGSIAVSNARSNAQSPNAQSGGPTPSVCTSGPTVAPTPDPNVPYAPWPPKDVPRIDNSCPSSIVPSSVNGVADRSYNCQNRTDISNYDIMWFTAYTLQTCIDACSTYNKGNHTKDTPCKGVALAADLSDQYANNGGANCWLKSQAFRDKTFAHDSTTFAWLADE